MAPDETRTAHAGPRRPDEVREYNDRVWDMVLYLVTPVFLYVTVQILIISRFGPHPLFRRGQLLIFPLQFLGAWALFYATLLRDMGFRSYAGPVLGVTALLGLAAQFVIFPDPLAASDSAVAAFLAVQLIPAALCWLTTFARWTRLKRRHLDPEGTGEA